jgi:hypothetical protein
MRPSAINAAAAEPKGEDDLGGIEADRRGGRRLGPPPTALRSRQPAPARSSPAAGRDCREASGGKETEPRSRHKARRRG